MPSIMSGSLIRATPPCARMSAGTRSSAMTATAPASSASSACSGVTTSMITPPLSISASPRLTRNVPVSLTGLNIRKRSGAHELPVEPERDHVRRLGPGELVERGGIEHEQERPARVRVEHDGEQHALVLALGARSRHEHGLARKAARLRPDARLAPLDVGL